MLALDSLRKALLGRLSRVAPEELALPDALGHVAAEDVTSPALPGHANALIDGWAVEALSTVGAGPYTPAPLPATSEPVRAGEPLPAGCDAVLPADAVTLDFGQP